MKTIAQSKTPKKTYGKQTERGNIGERKAASILRKDGWSVSLSPEHPRGAADIIARKGNRVRKIQVKRISSRTFSNAETARNRFRGKPYYLDKLPAGVELWVFDQVGHLYTFKE